MAKRSHKPHFEQSRLEEFVVAYREHGNAAEAGRAIGIHGNDSTVRLLAARMLREAKEREMIERDFVPRQVEEATQAFIVAEGDKPVATRLLQAEEKAVPPPRFWSPPIRAGLVAREVRKTPLAITSQKVLERLTEIANGETPEQEILRLMGTPARVRDFVTMLGERGVRPNGEPVTRGFEVNLDKAITNEVDHLIKKLSHDPETGAPRVEWHDAVAAITALLTSRQRALETLAKIYGLSSKGGADDMSALSTIRKQVMAVLLRSEKDRRAFDALSGRVLDAPRVLETEAVDVTPPPDQPDPPEEEPLPEIGVELDPEAPPEPAPPEDSPTP